jgi:hypothetical protein
VRRMGLSHRAEALQGWGDRTLIAGLTSPLASFAVLKEFERLRPEAYATYLKSCILMSAFVLGNFVPWMNPRSRVTPYLSL